MSKRLRRRVSLYAHLISAKRCSRFLGESTAPFAHINAHRRERNCIAPHLFMYQRFSAFPERIRGSAKLFLHQLGGGVRDGGCPRSVGCVHYKLHVRLCKVLMESDRRWWENAGKASTLTGFGNQLRAPRWKSAERLRHPIVQYPEGFLPDGG